MLGLSFMAATKRIMELLELSEDEQLEIARTLLANLMKSDRDELDDEGRRRLHESLDRAEESSLAGRVRPGHMLLADLRARSSK